MTFIITHNVIDEEEPKQRTDKEKAKYPHYFELYDDDTILYLKGYSKYDSCEKAFNPLDCYESWGCTGIKYKDTTGNMEWL